MLTQVWLFGSTAAPAGIGRLIGEVDVHHDPLTDPSAPSTALVAGDVAVEVPAVFAASTFTRSVDATSPLTGT